MNPVIGWFTRDGRRAFPFQERAWRAYLDGFSGLIHAPTGMGKSYAAWLGPLMEYAAERGAADAAPVRSGRWARAASEPIRVLWLTPMRALATDTVNALTAPIADLGWAWTIEKRTSDTGAALRAKQRERLPTCLVTTPESLSIMLSYADARDRLSTLRCVVVDEWHELLSTKRGVQAELCLARLRQWNPGVRVWGLSATLSNLDVALEALLGTGAQRDRAAIIGAEPSKAIEVESLLPPVAIERFPWAGHLGMVMLPEVLAAIERARTTLLFTNTRSQAELWFRAITRAKPEWMGEIALHHGSLDRAVREQVEDLLRAGAVRCVVCTSSLDLGVDYSPVEQVIQAGGPKGVARLIQRAGRSGHRPGATSRVLCAPANALELVEFSAAREAIARGELEDRPPMRRAIDVLAQHLVTIAVGEGFREAEMLKEVRSSHAFAALSDQEWRWCVDFIARGGSSLSAYPQFARVAPDADGVYRSATPRVQRTHRLAIGTITAELSMSVRYASGSALGMIEEDFIARLRPGDRFVFAGKTLELLSVRDMTAVVRKSAFKSGAVPHWAGSRMPISSRLAHAVRRKLDEAREGRFDGPEMQAVRPLLEIQGRWSRIPAPHELLIERVVTREGHHTFLFPFEGRLVHEGLGALLAHRVTRRAPRSVTVVVNDYGLEILSRDPLEFDAEGWRGLLSTGHLIDDLLECVNSGQLARRQFRDIARIAGLIFQGYPGATKPARHLQASSELFFDVFSEFDPGNLLLEQARHEVLSEQLEVSRLRTCLERAAGMSMVVVDTERLTPLAFPLWAESLRMQHVTSERWEDRVRAMVDQLERAASAREPVR